MSLANEVIHSLGDKGLTLAKPVIRHGDKPQILKAKNETDMIAMIKDVVEQDKNRVYKSFAVVCKSRIECVRIHRELKKVGVEATLITGEEGAYVAGVVMTRALHKLYVGYIDGTIPLLDKVDRGLFEQYAEV